MAKVSKKPKQTPKQNFEILANNFLNKSKKYSRNEKSTQFRVSFEFDHIPTYSGIYYIEDRGLVRIGRSENVRSRFKSHLLI